jgi:hypothetical protein
MKITKEQIKYIDHRLESDGVKYWDIRIEMVDHVVSNVENKLQQENSENDFKEMVQESFIELGWKENFNGGGLESVFLQRLKIYSKGTNKGILKEYQEKLSDIKVIAIIVMLFLYLFIFQNNTFVIKSTVYLALLVFTVAFIWFSFRHKVFNSVRLNRSIIFATIPLSILNCAMFFPNFFLGYEKLSSSYVTAVFGVILPFSIIGINFLYKEFKSAQIIYKKLIDS